MKQAASKPPRIEGHRHPGVGGGQRGELAGKGAGTQIFYLIEVGHILTVLQDPGVEGLPCGRRRT